MPVVGVVRCEVVWCGVLWVGRVVGLVRRVGMRVGGVGWWGGLVGCGVVWCGVVWCVFVG